MPAIFEHRVVKECPFADVEITAVPVPSIEINVEWEEGIINNKI